MAVAASCSSSSSKGLYDVFLSFRGEDTRRGFIAYLYKDLCTKGIKTYKDNIDLEKGDEVGPALLQAIENSYICIVVLSKDYAGSTWCLRELTHILECKKEGEIIPVFYEIDPSHVRKQTGSYMEAFEKHEKDSKVDEETVSKWKTSLERAANFSGWDSQSRDYRDESNFIDEIVKKVLQKLSCRYFPNESSGLIGIEENIRSIESLLGSHKTLGIWGMGGIGKTTLAKAVSDKLSPKYDGHCFLANVREKSEQQHGLEHLRNDLLSKLLGEKVTAKGDISFIMSRLKRKKVFIVLDDVDDSQQLEHLIGDYDFLGSDSRFIVTTRDKQVLMSVGVEEIYEVHTLKSEESIKLFKMNAFNQNHPEIGFGELTKKAVDYAAGIPLALKVLGSSLCSKKREVWESVLRKLESCPNKKIQNVLRLSYNGLEDTEKKIFLDITCFFKGENKSTVIRILDACDFFAEAGIETLLDRALITINSSEEIEMHDLIEEMGKEIIRTESINEFGKHSRLWDLEEVYDVLQHSKDFVNLRTIDISKSENLLHVDLSILGLPKLVCLDLSYCYNLESLLSTAPLKSLEELSVQGCSSMKEFSLSSEKIMELNLRETAIETLPSSIGRCSKLKYLYLPYSLKNLPNEPLNLRSVEELVVGNCRELETENLHIMLNGLRSLKTLELSGCCKLSHLPASIVNLSQLSTLSLRDCQRLQHLRELSPSIERLEANNCENLRHVDLSISCLPNLALLDLSCCPKLESLLSTAPLVRLNVKGCSSLKEFSLSSEEIMELDLRDTTIEILPSSIGRCRELKHLYLPNSLKNLPKELSNLRSLQKIVLGNGSELDKGALSMLEMLKLDGSSVESLPASITHASTLSVQNFSRLQDLPEIQLSSLETINLELQLSSSTIEIGVDGTGFDLVCPDELYTLDQRKELNEFIFQSLSADCCKQKSVEDLRELNFTCLMHNRFNELEETVQEGGACPTDVSELQNSIVQMGSDMDLELALGVKSRKEMINELGKMVQDCRVLLEDDSEPVHSLNGIELGLSHKSKRCKIDLEAEQQLPLTENFMQPLSLRLELTTNSRTCLYNEENEVGGFHHENKNDYEQLFTNNIRKDHFLGENLNGLSESDTRIVSEYQNSVDQMELALEADKEKLHLTKNLKDSSLQRAVPIEFKWDLNIDASTCSEIEEIEAGGSYNESKESHTKEIISQSYTTPTEMRNDDKDLGETFSCGYFIGFLWKRLWRSISTLDANFRQ